MKRAGKISPGCSCWRDSNVIVGAISHGGQANCVRSKEVGSARLSAWKREGEWQVEVGGGERVFRKKAVFLGKMQCQQLGAANYTQHATRPLSIITLSCNLIFHADRPFGRVESAGGGAVADELGDTRLYR